MSLIPRRSKRKLVSCQDCSEPDDSDMVRCDKCGKWSHFRCANVGIEVEKFYWSCHRCTGTFETAKAMRMKTKVKSKMPKIQIRSSFVNSESIVMRLEDYSRENMDRRHLRPRSDLPFNKPPVPPLKATKTAKPPISSLKNDAEKKEEEIQNLRKEIEFLRMKTVSVDVSTQTDVEIGHHVSTETDVKVGLHVSTGTDVSVGHDASTETDVEVERRVSTETDVEVERRVSTETEVDVGHDVTTGTDVKVGRDESKTSEPASEASQAMSDTAEVIVAKFPFHELTDAENFEERLGDATLYKIISQRLASKCGTGGKVPLNVLNTIMSKNLQGELNWEPKGTTIKSFPNILSLINFVGRAKFGTYDEKAANELIKTSLRNARSSKKK